MLCINFYLDSPLYSFMESINPDVSQKVAIINETLAENVDELISEKLTAARERVFADRTIQAVNRNREIIFSLYSRRYFQYEGFRCQSCKHTRHFKKYRLYAHT